MTFLEAVAVLFFPRILTVFETEQDGIVVVLEVDDCVGVAGQDTKSPVSVLHRPLLESPGVEVEI